MQWRTMAVVAAAAFAALTTVGCGQAGAADKLPKAMGCFKDQSNNQSELGGRDLNGFKAPSSQKMTVEMCASACKAKGFTYAGVQNSSECYCGDAYGRTGKSTSCTAVCAGNPGQMCGGYFSNSVYKVK